MINFTLICLAATCTFLLFTTERSKAEVPQETIQEGVRLFQAGKFDEAAAKFQEVLDNNPMFEDAVRNLANTRAAQAHRMIQKGNLTEAKQYLEQAIDLQPEDPQFHLLMAVVLFRQGDLYYSRYAVNRAIDLDPENSQAHELSGNILYREGYLDLAIPEWEAALKKSKNHDALQKKISKAREEIEVEQGLNRDVSSHFTLQIDDSVPSDVFQKILEELEETYDRLQNELGGAPPEDITVILYTRKVFNKITQSPDWAGGTFDGKIRIAAGRLSSELDVVRLKPILAHELTHAFLRSMVARVLPPWFEEGLAEYFEGTTIEQSKEWLKKYAGKRFSTLDEVSAALRGRGSSVEAAYYAAAIAVETLVNEEGFWTIRNVLEEVGSGISFSEALEDEARLSLVEFQELWLGVLP